MKFDSKLGLQEEQHEHGHGEREEEKKGKTDKRITESKARQKEALHCVLRRLNQGNTWATPEKQQHVEATSGA
jgi:hypothetical protein